MVVLGRTDHDEVVTMNRRAAESDLLVYVNITWWPWTGAGSPPHRPGRLPGLRHHHNVHTMQHSRSFMDRPRSELHRSNWRQGEVIKANGPPIFRSRPPSTTPFGWEGPAVLQKREWEWTARDRASFMAMQAGSGDAARGLPGRVRAMAGAL